MSAPSHILLADLLAGHPLLSVPLGDIAAEYLAGQPRTWRSVVHPSRYRIAGASYSQLGRVWTDGCPWRAPMPLQTGKSPNPAPFPEPHIQLGMC